MPSPVSNPIARAARERRAAGGVALAVLALILLAPASPARAGEAWSRLRAPERAIAGSTIEIVLPEPLGDVEEFEVLLSLDDGRTFPVRVTPELPAGRRTFRWRVPAFAAGQARLRLRYREDELERDGVMSEAFEIVAVGQAPDLHVFHECGWWEGLDAGGAALPEAWEPGGAPRWIVSPGEPAAVPAAPASLPVPRLRGDRRGVAMDGSPILPSPPPDPFRERRTPLRN